MPCLAAAKTWVDYLTSILPILISGSVGVIVLFQWRLAKRRILAEMYDRRFAVYESSLNYYYAVMQDQSKDKSMLFAARTKFQKCWRESQFLFDKRDGVIGIIDAFRVALNQYEYRAERDSFVHVVEPLALEGHLNNLEEAMRPYLDLTQWGRPKAVRKH